MKNSRTLLAFSIVLFSFMVAKAEVKEWNLNRINDQGLATQSAMKKLKQLINANCKSLSSEDRVEVASQIITGEDSYGGTPLQSSDLVLLRQSQDGAYIIKATVGWDYDLPMPQADVIVEESSNCQWKPL